MLPIKIIISPIDFSEPSDMGMKSAIELAEQFSAELVVVHVINPLPVISSSAAHLPEFTEELYESARKGIEDLFREVIPNTIRARYQIVDGSTADSIVKTAREEEADLIVIATHGQSGWRKFVFGSVTEKVIRLAECPVLTIRPRGKL
jgi:nucleotide-binding universal stress UspA family protein